MSIWQYINLNMKYNSLSMMQTEYIPTVSVVVTVYNGEKYLVECLDSILSQSLNNIEIICVDDASTDDTAKILSEYQDKITIITNEVNCMAGESRNKGLQSARGEYVIFLDADDIYEPYMLEKAYNKAKASEADICIFKEDLFTDSLEKCSGYAYSECLMKELGECDFFSPSELTDAIFSLWNGWAWDKLFRRDFILQTGLKFQNLQSSNDAYFVHAAMASARKISLLNEVLVHHRIGNSTSISNTRDNAWESCLLYLKELKLYLSRNGLVDTYKKSYVNWSLDFLYWNYQTLNDANRVKLATAIKDFLINDLNIQKYNIETFYNKFYKWFADCIVDSKTDIIPITEIERFKKTYQLNSDKIEILRKYILSHGFSVALWGAGIRGQAFADIYGEEWTELKIAYDMDKAKHGTGLCHGLTIKGFDISQDEKADFILVLNSAHLLSVAKLLNGEKIALFDMDSYIKLSNEVDRNILPIN